MKLCIDCKHYVADGMGATYDKCHHPMSVRADENNGVRAVIPVKHFFCSSMRMLHCEDAVLWEAK